MECPHTYRRCPDCMAFIKLDLGCEYGYTRTREEETFPPGLEPEPSEIGTVKSRW